jgi:isocitrate dehydrogenase
MNVQAGSQTFDNIDGAGEGAEQVARIAVAYGDGIGPEIMTASLSVLHEAGARLEIQNVVIGEKAYLSGHTAGLDASVWDVLRDTQALYKAPITTPQGGGYKSLNVTIRKSLGMFANVRPCVSYAPVVETRHAGMDVVIIRENEEDLYAGIEHRQTDEVYQCLKLISRPGCEKIIRYAFEYARVNGRKKVSCFTKDNIMKLTDGLFHKVFDEVASEYPEIETDHWIIDIGAAMLADQPDVFDVVVAPNLYGDIISDITAQISGSVGIGPSANIGAHGAMFEAIHGSAPTIAGQGIANPSGLILAGAMMLAHLGQSQIAEKIHNAWLRTIEDGIHTPDLFAEGVSVKKVGTQEFGEAVAARLGQKPEKLAPVAYDKDAKPIEIYTPVPKDSEKKELVGIDVFVQSRMDPNELGKLMCQAEQTLDVKLEMITNRGVKVWPDPKPETFCTDHWRCRYMAQDGTEFDLNSVVALLSRLASSNVDFIKTEQLYTFDGVPGYSLGHGQ